MQGVRIRMIKTLDINNSNMMRGFAVSSGVRQGVAYVMSGHLPIPRQILDENKIQNEISRFKFAVDEAQKELLAIQVTVRKKIGRQGADIFNAQIFILKDVGFLNEISIKVMQQKINVEAALDEVVGKYTEIFDSIQDSYLRERASDIKDVGRRVLTILMKGQKKDTFSPPEHSILVAEELLPSETAHIKFERVSAFITEKGGKTSHTSILARSLGIPAVIGIKDATSKIKTGDRLIVDGLAGIVFINPQKTVSDEYARLEVDFRAYRNTLKKLIDQPAVTQDGVKVRLSANIGKLADAETAYLFKMEGVGLYRTEFSFLIRDHFPSEDEQYEIYKNVCERLKPDPVMIRLLDVGSDKVLPYFPLPYTKNPSLGERGIRLLLAHPEIFKTQVRAILRLSATYAVGILLPVVIGVEDILESKKLLDEVKRDLRLEGMLFNPHVPLGIMIETPAAAIRAARMVQEIDFLSIGTNDLTQYLLTADRTSDEMAARCDPLHPAILQMIRFLVETVKDSGKAISICGEMAGDSACTALLLGLGLRNFSVAAGVVLEVKKAICSVSIKDAELLAKAVLAMDTLQEVKDYLKSNRLSFENQFKPNY